MPTAQASAIGTRHRVKIADVAFGGDGVARLDDGRVAFVPLVGLGEEVTIEIVAARKNFLHAKLVSIEVPSPDRVQPPCVVYGRCGGCAYQHLSYPAQLALKERQLAATLRRVGHLTAEDAPVRPIVASPREFEYRNRITVHLANGAAGFHAAGSNKLVEIARCEIAEPAVNEALAALAANRRRKREDGHRTLRADRTRRFFHQANDFAAAELMRVVSELVGAGGASLVDAYCGAGWFIKELRGRFAQCLGLEWDRYAVEEARKDALDHERYLEGDVALLLPEALANVSKTDTTLILDPPAEGLAAAVSDEISHAQPQRVIYVSCHPATLARDLARLKRGGYKIEHVTPVDMFPQTAEIEAVAFLTAR
ncbi:MAG: class I SAM-dependent RNA methyltransferase [Verrucomicrobia bacterium]|nr:class I SAM-dependent RNA methyltransferase [Verrucomicrobiota bacterium]